MAKKLNVTAHRHGKIIRYQTPDKGAQGRTPESEQFYHPNIETGWQKDMPGDKRRDLMLRSHKGDNLAAGRAMQALANVTTDQETKKSARKDALFFFSKMGNKVHRITPRTPRITTRTPRLR